MKKQLLGFALASIASWALADQIGQATPETYVSSFGRYRLTVFPLEHPDAQHTHSELMVNLPRSAQHEVKTACEATLEKWVGNGYEVLWRKPLANKFSPESALVSAADGSFVTFDDWGETGYGENVVVIYAGSGDLVKKFALSDIMTKEEIEKLPHTVGSIQWSGHHILVDGESIVELRVGTNGEFDEEKRKYRNIWLRMSDGSLVE